MLSWIANVSFEDCTLQGQKNTTAAQHRADRSTALLIILRAKREFVRVQKLHVLALYSRVTNLEQQKSNAQNKIALQSDRRYYRPNSNLIECAKNYNGIKTLVVVPHVLRASAKHNPFSSPTARLNHKEAHFGRTEGLEKGLCKPSRTMLDTKSKSHAARYSRKLLILVAIYSRVGFCSRPCLFFTLEQFLLGCNTKT